MLIPFRNSTASFRASSSWTDTNDVAFMETRPHHPLYLTFLGDIDGDAKPFESWSSVREWLARDLLLLQQDSPPTPISFG
jgi:hypothetical protein